MPDMELRSRAAVGNSADLYVRPGECPLCTPLCYRLPFFKQRMLMQHIMYVCQCSSAIVIRAVATLLSSCCYWLLECQAAGLEHALVTGHATPLLSFVKLLATASLGKVCSMIGQRHVIGMQTQR